MNPIPGLLIEVLDREEKTSQVNRLAVVTPEKEEIPCMVGYLLGCVYVTQPRTSCMK